MILGKYFCLDHCIEYTDDDMMCPQCEKEICDAHDKHMENKMTDFTPVDSKALQEESLVRFMAAVGYEPVYDNVGRLRSFYQPKFSRIGKARISINHAIKAHNGWAEQNFNWLIRHYGKPTTTPTFKEFIQKPLHIDALTIIFAGTCKIVQQIKGCGSNKVGFKVHDHNVKFMTKQDKRQYGHMVGL